MTHEQRLDAIEESMAGLAYVNLQYRDGEPVRDDFSWYHCDMCGTREGGARYTYAAFVEDINEWSELLACECCTMEIEYPGEEHGGCTE